MTFSVVKEKDMNMCLGGPYVRGLFSTIFFYKMSCKPF